METISMKYVAVNGPPRNATLVDLRRPEEYARGHIPGAINVPYERLNCDRVRFDKSKKLVFYCLHGSKSMAACARYERCGYYTCDLLGGYDEYRRAMRKKVFDGMR